jgi:hypothetical protein
VKMTSGLISAALSKLFDIRHVEARERDAPR